MEFSSPLAAIRPSQCARPWGFGQEPFGDFARSPSTFFGPTAPFHPASPSFPFASDLSAKFVSDQSPHLSTPRPSFFPPSIFQLYDKSDASPILRSDRPRLAVSPLFHPDADFSPLPHKPLARPSIRVTSPRRTSPKRAIDEVDSPVPSSLGAPFEARKRPATRSVFSRTKCLTTTATSMSSLSNSAATTTTTTTSLFERTLDSLPAFKFGRAASPIATTTLDVTGLDSSPPTPSLDQCFVGSPLRERRTLPSTLLNVPKPRSAVPKSSHGSPSSMHKDLLRARKHCRRSNSMFTSAADVMQESTSKDDEPVAPIDIEDNYKLRLPHTLKDADSLPRISQDTLIRVLEGEFDSQFTNRMIVDCRFEYEFNGGHIDGAVNYNDKEALAKELFGGKYDENMLVILHCEYSAHRAPLMAKFVRQHDRSINAHCYPKLSFPEVYILDGGYSSFFRAHRTRCFPQNYVEMDDKAHEQACEQGMHKLRQRSKLSRAATYAFGEVKHQTTVDNSPLGRTIFQRSSSSLFVSVGTSSPTSFSSGLAGARSGVSALAPRGGLFDSKRVLQTRRMASY